MSFPTKTSDAAKFLMMRAILLGGKSAVAAAPLVIAGTAAAQCAPTAGNDVCSVIGVDGGATLDMLAGNDILLPSSNAIVGDTGAGTILLGDGNDSIRFIGGYNYSAYTFYVPRLGNSVGSLGVVRGDAGFDTIRFGYAYIGHEGAGSVSGGDGSDSISLFSFTVLGNNSGASGIVNGDAGGDVITLTNVYVGVRGAGTVSGGDGNDTIQLDNSSRIGLSSGSSGVVRGDAGDDSISMYGGSVGSSGAATVSGGDGNDTISFFSSVRFADSASSTAVVNGDAGNDSITLFDSRVGSSGAATVSGGDDNDTVQLTNSDLGDGSGARGVVRGDAGIDTFSLTSARVGNQGAGTVSGGDGDDIISISSSDLGMQQSGSGQVLGDAGNDSISASSVIIGYRGAGTVSGGDGNDTISVSNYSVVGSQHRVTGAATGQVNGDAGDDSITVTQSYVGLAGLGTVSGGDGADTINITNRSTIGDNFYDGEGVAFISRGVVNGDAGNDSITIDNSLIGRVGAATVSGGDGADIILVSNGSVLGDDATVFGFGFVRGTGVVDGGIGNDSITIDASTVGRLGSATVTGGDGADLITLRNGTSVNASSAITGGPGNDTVSINNTVVFASGAVLSGGGDMDTLATSVATGQTMVLGATSDFEILTAAGPGTLNVTSAAGFDLRTSVTGGTLSLTGVGQVVSSEVNVTGGTLITDGSGFGALPRVDVAAGGTLTVGGSEVVRGLINAGTLSVTSGTLTIMLPPRAHTGGTADSAEGPQSASLSDNALTSSGTASIASSATISTGSASLSGGTLTNAGTLTTTSGTTVASGATLTSTGTIQGGVTNAGTTNAAGTLQGAISNTGTINVTGALTGNGAVTNSGTFNLSGGNFTGATTFTNSANLTVGSGRTLGTTGGFTQSAGTLTNNGTITGPFANNGGIVNGAGTFQGLLTVSSGSLNPGNSIGTITASGGLTLSAGSNLNIEVTDGATDRINVTGTVTINGGQLTLLDLVGGPAPMDASATYVIISNDGTDAISGTGFATVIDNLAFLTPLTTMTGGDGNDFAISFASLGVDLTTVAANGEQQKLAGAFNPILAGGTPAGDIYVQAFLPLSPQAAAAGLQTLSGEAHAATLFLAGSDALALTGGKICDTDAETGFCASAQYENLNGDVEAGIAGTSQVDHESSGAKLAMGFQATPTLRLGAKARISEQTADIGALAAASIDSFGISVSAEKDLGPWRFAAELGRNKSDAAVTRSIVIGTLGQTAVSNYDLVSNVARAEASYGFAGLGGEVRPFALIAASRTESDGFLETGAGAGNLTGAKTEIDFGYTDVGARASWSLDNGGLTLTPEIVVAYSRLYGESTPDQTVAFRAGGPLFSALGAAYDRDRIRFGGGVSAAVTGKVSGFVRFEGLTASSNSENSFAAGLKINF